MKLLLAIMLIALISLLGSRLTFLHRRLPLGFRSILLTGVEYIFIGAVLGQMGLQVLDKPTLDSLEPFLVFGLCWVGFLFGLQFEIKSLKKLPRFYFSITIIEAIITFIWVSCATFWGLKVLLGLATAETLVAALLLGSMAACTAHSAIAIVSRNARISEKRLLGLLRYLSSVDGLIALIVFGLVLSLGTGLENGVFTGLKSLRWLGMSTLLGLLAAVILILLSRVKFTAQEYLVFLIGTIMFAAGSAQELQHSPLVTGLICGVLVANFCRHRLRAMDIVLHSERSIYVILLLLIGASSSFRLDLSLLLAIVYFFSRLMGKFSGVLVAVRLFKPQYPVPATLGLGLLSEGGLSIALILDFKLLYPMLTDTLSTIIIISIIVNELIGPRLILAQFDSNASIPIKG